MHHFKEIGSLQPKEYTIPDCKIKAYKHRIHVYYADKCNKIWKQGKLYKVIFK